MKKSANYKLAQLTHKTISFFLSPVVFLMRLLRMVCFAIIERTADDIVLLRRPYNWYPTKFMRRNTGYGSSYHGKLVNGECINYGARNQAQFRGEILKEPGDFSGDMVVAESWIRQHFSNKYAVDYFEYALGCHRAVTARLASEGSSQEIA